MRATLVVRVVGVLAVVAVAAVLTLGSALLLFGNALSLLSRVLLEVVAHAVDVVDAEARGEYRHLDALAQLGIERQSPLQLELAAEALHEVVDVVHLVHRQSGVLALLAGKRYGEEYLLGVVDVVVVEQRRVERILDGLLHSALALAVAGRHDSHAAVLGHRLHVVEVEVDESVNGDYLGYRLGSHAESVVGLAEGIEHGELGIYLAQPLVVDYEQCVDVLRHLLYSVESLVDFALALEAEGYGNDAHGQYLEFLRHASYHGRSSRSRSAAHAGSDEGHLGAVVEHIAYGIDGFLGSLARLLGLVACSESLVAELQVNGHGRVVECLVVGIAEHERHVVDAFAVHVVHGIAATAAYTNHLDDAFLLLGFTEV